MSDDIALLTIAELASCIRDGDLSPVDITQAYLDRIQRLDDTLHSFNCVMGDTALLEARNAEGAIRAGHWSGPLHGIPIGIKDMIDVMGVPTTAQAVHRKQAIAAQDAGVVVSLRQAGAVILGKQAMSEYAVGGTQLDHAWPPPCNPWDLGKDALSSSSGGAVAVAAGLCGGAIGTETAGSIRAPAAWCGVAGLKPTNGMVSTAGVLPLSPTMDCVGPLAWTVEDCAILLSGMTGAPCKEGWRNLDGAIAGLRVGVARSYFENDPVVDPEILAATDLAVDALIDLGAVCVDVVLPDFDALCATAKAISWPEEYRQYREDLAAHPDWLTEVSRSRLQDGQSYSDAEYRAALLRREEIIAELRNLMQDIDLLILPTLKKPAQPRGFEFTDLGKTNLDLTRPFNLTGGPALTMCHGFSDEGLPLSLQIIGRHDEDTLVLRAGHALEQALGVRNRRPQIATL
ncbi:amidase [Shimia sp. NS0008-38b]|uniref:amidase n=1 Tax=Shimia sp. NS0008-38b TaxID=3127653 RepID=UPI0031024A4E